MTLAVLALLFAPAAAVVSAAPAVTFGPPSATATWGKGIDFVQPVVASALTRVEILVDYPGLAGPLVSQVPTSGGGQLTFTVDASKGEVLPNTTLTARWRLTRAGEPPTVGPPVSATYRDTRFQWRTKMGSIVRLHWYQGDDAFAARAVQLGDGAVKKAADLLGVTETQPIDFYVYADQNAFYDALGPGTPENIAGEAHPEIRTMFGLITPDAVATSEVARVVTHELTHLVFDTATRNPYDEPAHWINEGVAVYLSVGYGSDDRAAVAQAARDGTIMPLPSLSGRFPTTYDRLLLAYSEAVSAIDLLVRT
ncbi:MAG: peptidase MA family metallohydrolase, partial [Candidatus Limnocylindrales bacterium]